MPTIRYRIRNEYGLAEPELYRAADKDDPEAVLEGVAMAGLVGVLRQLGDLVEFAAGIFHDLHEEVTATAARGHGLMLRVQQLEAEFPSIEKAFLVQTNHSHFAYDEGLDWRANLRINQNLITQGDMPRFIMDSYEECRGPPRLFMLDKFDVAGAGACLKRYSDPSFFKVEFASSGMMEEEVQIEKKARKIRKRASHRRNDDTAESFLAPLVNSNLQQERDDKVSARVPNRRVKLKCRNLNESDISNRRSYMEHLLEVHSLEQKVWPENSISDSPVDVKPIVSGELTSEVRETVIDTITDSTIIREAYPTESPTRKEVTYIPRNELDGRYAKSVRRLKFVPKERITTESEIKTEVSDDGYMPCKAENRSPLLQDVELRKSFADGEFTIKGGYDGNKSNGYRSGESEKNPARESLGYAEFNPVGEYEDYRSDNVSSDLENYVDALNTIGSEIETDSGSRVQSDPRFSNVADPTTDSGIDEHQQEVPEKPLELVSVEKPTSSREWSSGLERSTHNSVISGDLVDMQQSLQDANRDNFHQESPDRTPDEIQGNNEVRECAVPPIKTFDSKESYVPSIMSEVRETSAESLPIDYGPLRHDTGSNYVGDTLVDAKEYDVTSIMSEVRETLAESLVMDLKCSPLGGDTVSNYVGDTLVSEQLDGKAVGFPNFSNGHDDVSCETIPSSEVGNLSFGGRHVPEGIDPAECVEEQTSAFDTIGHHSKDHNASEEKSAQHVEESTVTLISNAEEQQASVKEAGACFDRDALPNITEASPENGDSIVHPAVLAEETLSNDVKNSHEVTRNLDGILPHADVEFTNPVINSRILSDDLLPLFDIQHAEDVGPVSFKDAQDAGHIQDLPPLSSVQLRASHDPMEQYNNASSCEVTLPSNSALSLENNHVTMPDVFATGMENPVTSDEDNAEVVDERKTVLADMVPAELKYLSNADDSQKFNGVSSEELFTLPSEKEALLDDMLLQLNSSAEDAGENNFVMPNVKPLKSGHFSDMEEPESSHANSRDKVPLDSARVMSSADMQLQDEESECMAYSNAEESKESLPELGHFSDVEEPESCNADTMDTVPLDSASVMSSAGRQLQGEESECMANSNAEESKESPLSELGCFSDVEEAESCNADSMDTVPLDSASVMSSAGRELRGEESEFMANSYAEESKESPLSELGHFSDVEEAESYNADSRDTVPLDSASVMSSADMQLQDEESECVQNSNVEISKESPPAGSEDPKESSSAELGEHFPLDSGFEMFPDDIQVQNKEVCCMEMDGATSAADAMVLSHGSDLQGESLHLEKQIDDDSLDEYVIVEADDNSQGTCSVYSNSGKTYGFGVQLQENYLLPAVVALNQHGKEVDLSDQDNLALPSQFESQPKISTEIGSSILQIQHLSDDSNPSDTKLLDNVCCTLPVEDSKPNIDKEDLIYCSSENEYYGSEERISPSTHSLVETNTPSGDDSGPNVVFSQQEGSDTQFQRPCTNDNKSISRDIEDGPPQPEPCIFDSKGESKELDTSLCNIDMHENVESEASVASRHSSEFSGLQPIASSSQAVSETSLQEALETWLDKPTPSFQIPDVNETPPLPPLPPLEWRLGNLRLASQTSSGDSIQPPAVTGPFVEQTSGEEKHPQGPANAAVEMSQTEKPCASLPVVENEGDQHGSFVSEEKDEERQHKSLSLEAEMTNPSTSHGEWQHGQQNRPPLAHLISSLELERSQHESLSVAGGPMLPMNPFLVGPSIEEWNHRYGYGVYGGGSMQQLNLPPSFEAGGPNMPPYGFFYSMGENSSNVYNFMIPTADGENPNRRYRSIRDRPRDPLIEAVAAHDKSKLRKVTEQDHPSVKPKTDERDSLLEEIRNKSFNLKPANATRPNIKGFPPTNLKVAAILEKANAIRQACAGSDEDDEDGDSWSDN